MFASLPRPDTRLISTSPPKLVLPSPKITYSNGEQVISPWTPPDWWSTSFPWDARPQVTPNTPGEWPPSGTSWPPSNNPELPEGYWLFAVRLMALIWDLAFHRYKYQTDAMYPWFDLTNPLWCQAPLLNMATLWLESMWNTHVHPGAITETGGGVGHDSDPIHTPYSVVETFTTTKTPTDGYNTFISNEEAFDGIGPTALKNWVIGHDVNGYYSDHTVAKWRHTVDEPTWVLSFEFEFDRDSFNNPLLNFRMADGRRHYETRETWDNPTLYPLNDPVYGSWQRATAVFDPSTNLLTLYTVNEGTIYETDFIYSLYDLGPSDEMYVEIEADVRTWRYKIED